MSNDKRNTEERQQTPQHDVEKTPASDPQESMEGPVSSLMHETGNAFDTEETQEEADQERDKNM
jgi:hypothetical protein